MFLEHDRRLPPEIERDASGGGAYRCHAAEVTVRIGGAVRHDAYVLHVYHTQGGRQLDRATIGFKLTAPLADMSTLPEVEEVSIEAEVEVPAGAAGGKVGRQVYFWGFTSGTAVFDAKTQLHVVEARQAPYHFGRYVLGQAELSGGGSEYLLETDLVFNPQFDAVSDHGKRISGVPSGLGSIRGNRDERKTQAGHYAFLDPLRTFTAAGRKHATGKEERPNGRNAPVGVQAANDFYWTLPQVVHYLCLHCNPGEKYFKNPTLEDLEDAIDPESPDERGGGGGGAEPAPEPTSPTEPGGELNPEPAPLAPRKAKQTNGRQVRHLRVPLGTYLPEALDRVLAPFGYSWRVDYATDEERRIEIVKRGEGPEKVLRWQHHEERELDPEKTWVDGLSVNVGVQSLVNAADVRGDFKLFEATYELQRGWGPGDDNLDDTQLSAAAIMANPARWPAWRLWVLNEAGDYNGLTRGGQKLKTYDFKPVFGIFTLDRRRRFHPCITLTQDRQPVGRGGYEVEWSLDEGANWRPVEELSNGAFDVLASECGIWFSGDAPPKELRLAGDKARVRITASVYSDERIGTVLPGLPLEPTATRHADSIQPESAAQYIEAGNRYFYREVTSRSKYAERVRKNEYASSELDDTERAKLLAQDFVRAWDQADVSGTIEIPYLWAPEEIVLGDVLTEVEGRAVDLEIGNPYATRYPQVTGIHFDFQEQRTNLTVETFRDTRYV